MAYLPVGRHHCSSNRAWRKVTLFQPKRTTNYATPPTMPWHLCCIQDEAFIRYPAYTRSFTAKNRTDSRIFLYTCQSCCYCCCVIASEDGQLYYPIFFTNDNAFEEFYCICIQLVNKTWKEMRATSIDFTKVKQDNVHMNTESVQCILTVYSICPYKYNQWAV